MMIMIFARGLREHERDKRRGEGAGNIHEGDGRQRCLPAQDSSVDSLGCPRCHDQKSNAANEFPFRSPGAARDTVTDKASALVNLAACVAYAKSKERAQPLA
jgi:hypothetical protein